MNTIFAMVLVGLAIALIAIRVHRKGVEAKANIKEARARAAERKTERAFLDTEPLEDPYDKMYNLKDAMSAVEVDESANGYGLLTDEQKRVISAIFDTGPVSSKTLTIDDGAGKNRWPGSVFSELNQVERISEKDIWSNSRN